MSKYKCARCGKVIDSTGYTLYVPKCSNCGRACSSNAKCPHCGVYNYGLDGEDLRDYNKRWICSCGCINYYDNTRYYERSSSSESGSYRGGGGSSSGEGVIWLFLIIIIGVPAAAWIFFGIDPISLFLKVVSPVFNWLINL